MMVNNLEQVSKIFFRGIDTVRVKHANSSNKPEKNEVE